MKNNLSRTVRLVSPLEADEVRSRLRLQFMPGEPCYSGNVEGMSFLLESTTVRLSGRKWNLANVTRMSVCPNLHVSLNPYGGGTIIGIYSVPALFSDINTLRYLPIIWLVMTMCSLLTFRSVGTLLLLCVTLFVFPYLWKMRRKAKSVYTDETDEILKRLATILQATLEDVPEE